MPVLVPPPLPLLYRSALNPCGARVGAWIFGTSAAVVGLVQVGAWTRLTKSGLSMTDWRLLGGMPPRTREEWEAEFRRYKTFPEWQQRRSMTLQEFQYIYYWEWSHRMLGRTVGLVFGLPWLYWTARGRIPAGFQPRMVGLLCMGGTQGLVGWWMVKSGLGEDRRGDRNEIRVKPVRLAAHLTMAIATYSALVWTGLDLWSLPHNNKRLTEIASSMGKEAFRQASLLRLKSLALAGLTAATITSGAIVAGQDAGLAYNTFPTMDGEWIPSTILELSPWHRNLVENTATVQWNHRVLGTTTALTAASLATMGLRRPAALTPQARKGLYAVGVTASAQFALGVTTLLTHVPLPLAAAHQLGAVVTLTSSLYLAHALRYARPSLLIRGASAAMGK
jgi:cytochrome c oxidase assembly protein subunit 15